MTPAEISLEKFLGYKLSYRRQADRMGFTISMEEDITLFERIGSTLEVFEIRHAMLRDSIQEFGLALDLMERWLRIDRV